MSGIPAIGQLALRAPDVGEVLTPTRVQGKDGVGSFSQMMVDAVESANSKHLEAMEGARAFAEGARDDIHGTMIAIKEAEIELKLVSNVRTKLVEAWNDLWRMSV
jgi:flagellar hook-basal body complex protein FliE